MAKHSIINLRSVAFATMYYVNQYGHTRRNKPRGETIFDGTVVVDREAVAYPWYHDYPNETELERARRLEILDDWRPVTRFVFSKRHSVKFTDEKAIEMWKAWSAYIFNKK